MLKSWISTACAVLVAASGCGDDGGGENPGARSDTGSDIGRSDTAPDNGTGDSAVSADLPRPPALGLVELIDYEDLFDRTTLDFEIQLERSGNVPGDFDEPVYQVGIRFRSQTYLGSQLYHEGLLIIPSTLTSATMGAAIIPRATANPIEDISDSPTYLPNYAAITASRLDMPVLVLHDIPPTIDLRSDTSLNPYHELRPDCFSGALANEARVEDCLRSLMQATGRLELNPTLPVAVAYSRAVTLLQELAVSLPSLDLPFDLPDFHPDGVAILGVGLGGYAVRYAMALDSRIVGAYTASADIGGLEAFHDLQQRVWNDNFSFGNPTEQLLFLRGPAGAAFLDVYGIEAISDAIADRTYLMSVGTNGPTSPLGALDYYGEHLPDDTALLYVAGYGDGFGTPDHLLAWRVFLAHIFRDRPWTEINSSWEDDGGNIAVTARLSGGGIRARAHVFFVQRHGETDDQDYRDAIWRSVEMEEKDFGTLAATFSSLARNTAFFVRIADRQDIYEGPITGPVHLIAR
jgi:hypothetical protein